MAEQCGQDIENRHIGMTQFRNVPGKMKMADFYWSFFDNLAEGRLPWLLRQHHRRQRSRATFCVGFADLMNDFGFFYVPSNHEKGVIGNVLLGVISPDVGRLQFME